MRGPIQIGRLCRPIIGTQAPQKTFDTFTWEVPTSPGGKLTQVFCGAFFQKSDRFLVDLPHCRNARRK
jgi:hypothetical protein